MKLYAFPLSSRVLSIMALKDYLEIECEVRAIDLSKGDHQTAEHAALNSNQKMPMLEDGGFIHLRGRPWLAEERLTIADFSVAGLIPSMERFGLPVMAFPEIARWYAANSSLPAWNRAIAAKDASMTTWLATRATSATYTR